MENEEKTKGGIMENRKKNALIRKIDNPPPH
jgi:hypothetical protein